jgi:leader peptidase (prepilin peptidase)/N-methyltransferase
VVRAIRAAWRAVGPFGQVVTGAGLAATVALTAAWAPSSSAALATGASIAILTIAALVDAVAHRLPNALVVTAAAPVVAALALPWSADLVRSSAAGAALLGGPLLVTHLIAPRGMGFGDVKAAVVLGAALGLLAAPLGLLALVLGLLAAALFALLRRLRTVALGPALVAGALLALVLGRLAGVDVVTS